jgi:hypothetical protein
LLGKGRTLGGTDKVSNPEAKRKLVQVVRILNNFQKAAVKNLGRDNNYPD